MRNVAIALGVTGLITLAAVPARAYTVDYSGFGPPDNIVGQFSLAGGADTIADLTGTVDGDPITSFLSGTYDGDQFTANFATRLASYNLNCRNGFIAVVTSGGSFVSIGSLAVAAVPLPGSAPMLGAALAAFGVLGAGLRRRRFAKAAAQG